MCNTCKKAVLQCNTGYHWYPCASRRRIALSEIFPQFSEQSASVGLNTAYLRRSPEYGGTINGAASPQVSGFTAFQFCLQKWRTLRISLTKKANVTRSTLTNLERSLIDAGVAKLRPASSRSSCTGKHGVERGAGDEEPPSPLPIAASAPAWKAPILSVLRPCLAGRRPLLIVPG
jgi:hypothetical protein